MDPRQRQRLGWIVRFFALLLVLTLLARGTAGAAMASVTVQRPSSGNVTKSVRTTATVSFAGGNPFYSARGSAGHGSTRAGGADRQGRGHAGRV